MEISDNDRLITAVAYVFTPLAPIIIMFLEDQKNRPFIQAHNMQSLVLGVVLVILNIVLGWTCVVPLLTLGLVLYYAYQAYQGQEFTIPVITDFVKNQGWA